MMVANHVLGSRGPSPGPLAMDGRFWHRLQLGMGVASQTTSTLDDPFRRALPAMRHRLAPRESLVVRVPGGVTIHLRPRLANGLQVGCIHATLALPKSAIKFKPHGAACQREALGDEGIWIRGEGLDCKDQRGLPQIDWTPGEE